MDRAFFGTTLTFRLVRSAAAELHAARAFSLGKADMAEKLPIVYVRGFASDTSGIDKVVTDPFCGFPGPVPTLLA